MSTFGMSVPQMDKYTELQAAGFEYLCTEESGAVIMEIWEHIYDAKLIRDRVAVNQDGSVNQLDV